MIADPRKTIKLCINYLSILANIWKNKDMKMKNVLLIPRAPRFKVR